MAVLGAFVASAFVVPTLAPVAISDDWVYMRSVEILLRDGRFEILTLSSANLLLQVLWGALFGVLFGPSLGVFRLSVVVLWLLGACACYGLLWELTRDRARSALGTAAYVFNPIGYSVAFTFMTDGPFVSASVIALYCYVRGVGTGQSTRWTLAGATAAACAILVRQPGVFIPFGVVVSLIATGHIRANLRGLRTCLEVAALPAAVFVAFYLWLRFVHGEPEVQRLMQRQIFDGGWPQLRLHALRLYIIEAAYLGLFVLPLAAGAILGLPRLARALGGRGWAAFSAWQIAVVGGIAGYWALGARMPYIPHFLSDSGIGPNDLMKARPPIYTGLSRDVFTVACALAALVFGLAVVRGLSEWRARDVSDHRAASVVLGSLVVNFLGALIVSAHFRYWKFENLPAPSLDRYLLPLLPLALAAMLWALRDVRFSLQLGWMMAIFIALFSIVGTRDNLAFHEANWELAREANAAGIPNLYLDAGAAWDGYYLGEESLATVGYHPRSGVLWWFSIYAPIIDARYAIASDRVPRYQQVILEKHYDLWLDHRPARLLLLRRDDVEGPP